jgi:hypothetical protein
VVNRIWDTYIQGVEINKTLYFLANHSEKESENGFLGLFLDILRFHIWQAKLEKKIPTTQKLTAEIQYSFETILKAGGKKLEEFINCPLFQIGRDERQRDRNRP